MNLLLKIKLKQELKKLNISCSNIDLIQNKDGVVVARVQSDTTSYIIKCFQNEKYKREIKNYQFLNSLNISTVNVFGVTDSAILMEDVSQSNAFRLGSKDDLYDVIVASKIAEWYKLLHTSSKDYVKKHCTKFYDETDFITRENIEFIKAKTNTQNLPVWKLIDDNFDVMVSKIKDLPRVLTYNDFYFTNLIVAINLQHLCLIIICLVKVMSILTFAMCSSLGENAKKAFLETYGEFDKSEIIVDDVASVLVTLYHACQRKTFPSWADYALEELKTNYTNKVQTLINS